MCLFIKRIPCLHGSHECRRGRARLRAAAQTTQPLFLFLVIYPVLADPAEIPHCLYQLGSSQKNRTILPSHSVEGMWYEEFITIEKAHRERRANQKIAISKSCHQLQGWMDTVRRWHNQGLEPLGRSHRNYCSRDREKENCPGFSLCSTFSPTIH